MRIAETGCRSDPLHQSEDKRVLPFPDDQAIFPIPRFDALLDGRRRLAMPAQFADNRSVAPSRCDKKFGLRALH